MEQLTLSEYEGAKLAEVQCLRESGLEVLDPHMNGIYLYRFVVDESATGKQPDAIGDCKKQYTSVLEAIWAEVWLRSPRRSSLNRGESWAPLLQARAPQIEEDHPEDSFDPEVFDKYTRCKEQMWSALDIEGISYGVEGDGRPR